MKIDGAVAIVTGGASGIGHAFCVALLENGAASVSYQKITSLFIVEKLTASDNVMIYTDDCRHLRKRANNLQF
jgi:NAD(P)-dependent dehydrogenase (short-subunit alcohol dehydrogenase family)